MQYPTATISKRWGPGLKILLMKRKCRPKSVFLLRDVWYFSHKYANPDLKETV